MQQLSSVQEEDSAIEDATVVDFAIEDPEIEDFNVDEMYKQETINEQEKL